MKNITAKPETFRSATAQAVLDVPAFCIPLLQQRKTEKGDALEIARMAGILAAKKTWELLPFCHQLSLTGIDSQYTFTDTSVTVTVTVEVIAGTGVAMEALTAASVTALTLWDMLKPHAEQEMMIREVRLLEKRGGKSPYPATLKTPKKAVILAPSDAVIEGTKRATAGQAARKALEKAGFVIASYELLPDDLNTLQNRVRDWLKDENIALILTVGGTGTQANDCAVEALTPLVTKPLPGIMEAARHYGQRRTPYALVSRGVAGMNGNTILLTCPGSTRGANETLAAIMTGLVHVVDGLQG